MISHFMNSKRIGAVICAVAISLSGVAAVRAADVSDQAGFFSADAVTKANQTIRDIEKKSGHEVRIETYATVPDGKHDAVAKMSKAERETFFSNWIHDRSEATKSRGLLILVCKSPAHVRLWAGNPLQQAGFTESQARPIREALVESLRAKEYDKALSNGVSQIGKAFDNLKHAEAPITSSNHAVHRTGTPGAPVQRHAAAPAPHQSGFGGLFWVMIIIVGGVILFSLVARMFSGGPHAPPPGYGPAPGYGPPGMGYGGYGGGGGFMRSLAGGIFGAMAGNWLYDQFGGHHAHAGDSTWHDSSSDRINDGGDSFGDSSGSGYEGGTDFGGGDFGGDSGDSGGSDMGGDDSF